MLNTAAAFTGHLLASATDHSVLSAPYCPPSRNEVWNAIKPAVDIIVGNIRGLTPVIIAVIVGLAILLAVGSFIPKVRGYCLPALGWTLAGAVAAGVVIAIGNALVGNVGC